MKLKILVLAIVAFVLLNASSTIVEAKEKPDRPEETPSGTVPATPATPATAASPHDQIPATPATPATPAQPNHSKDKSSGYILILLEPSGGISYSGDVPSDKTMQKIWAHWDDPIKKRDLESLWDIFPSSESYILLPG